jgi:16S rRNA G527 N7-methylase RsmG
MKAVENIAGELKLKNVTLVTGRAEDIAKEEKYQGAYDYIVSRAVSTVTELVSWGKPLLRSTGSGAAVQSNDREPVGQQLQPHVVQRIGQTAVHRVAQPGTIILYKGGDLTEEFKEARMKVRPEILTEEPIIVEGIDPEYTYEKKLVIIKP